MFKIIIDVAHAGFLVRAQQDAQRIGQCFAALFEELGHVQRHHRRAFVVAHAAPQKISLAPGHLERLARPAVALGHNIQMRDRSDLPLAFSGQIGIADVTVAVVCGKAHAPGDGERRIQRLLRTGAERCARLRLSLHAVHGHQRGQICKKCLFVLLNKRVYFVQKTCFVHIQ